MSWRGLLRFVSALAGGIALVLVVVSTESNANEERESSEASAIRLAETYTEGAFYAVVAAGGVLCAYVLSRVGEGETREDDDVTDESFETKPEPSA